MNDFASKYFEETRKILDAIQPAQIDELATRLAGLRSGGGRLFILGVGGSAAHASHAVNDFRKLCAIEAYAPTDNVAELTARINDGGATGWENAYSEWLAISKLSDRDALLVISVGGGNSAQRVSLCLTRAMEFARSKNAAIYGVVGRDGGDTLKLGTLAVVIPPTVPERATPHTEGLCSVILHCLVSHPALQAHPTRW